MNQKKQKITPFLWFDGKAEYSSTARRSRK